MDEGWFCRSMANAVAAAEDEEHMQDESKCKKQYKFLKKKFKNLIYENESFQEALRSAQKRLLVVTRDRNFLLDRLLQYEKVENSSSDTEDTDSSDDQELAKVEPVKKKKTESSGTTFQNASLGKTINSVKRKRLPASKQPKQLHRQPMLQMPINTISGNNLLLDGHMTPEEVERHLQSRQTFMELVPERAPPTVPTEMFSNDPSLDSESNDIGELETSPSNIGEELSIDMLPE